MNGATESKNVNVKTTENVSSKENEDIYFSTEELDIDKIEKLDWDDVDDSQFSFYDWRLKINRFNRNNPELSSILSNSISDFTLYFYSFCFNNSPDTFFVAYNKYFTNAFMSDLFEHFKGKIVSSYTFEVDNGIHDKYIRKGLFKIDNSTFMLYSDGDVEFFYDPNEENYALKQLLRVLKNYKQPPSIKNTINVVYHDGQSFSKVNFSIDDKSKNISIQDNYNDDFIPVNDNIIKKLNDKSKTGLFLLSGETGTGKTTYIRYLSSVLDRSIIFIPPSMVSIITSPEFIPFLMDNPDSVLIVEDAEPVLKKRDGERTGGVSNILNLTDGLLSDCLNISIVATFNTDIHEIDPALKRKGRLLGSYYFDKLSVDKAQNLMNELGYDFKVEAPMSLAEIYFYDNSGYDSGIEKGSSRVGFGAGKNKK